MAKKCEVFDLNERLEDVAAAIILIDDKPQKGLSLIIYSQTTNAICLFKRLSCR